MIRFLLISLFLSTSTLAQSPNQKITKYLQSYVDNNDYSGCVLISEGALSVYKHCFGYANIPFSIPNSTKIRFKIGSISKQFTAVAILKLEEAGLLTLEDPISKHIEVPAEYQIITIQQLLTHESGVKDIFAISGFSNISATLISFDELISILVTEPLNFEPGTQYEYSNGGYALLAKIIETVSEETYKQFLQITLFDVIGLENTSHFETSEVVSDLAEGYDPDGLFGLKDAQFISNTLLTGSGSLYSTVDDLKKWVDAIKYGSFLSDKSREKLFTNYGSNYGLGISLYTSFDRKVFGHDGRISGFIADYLHYEEEELTVIITGNIQTGVADYLRRDIAAILFDEEYESRAHSYSSFEAEHTEISTYSGRYSFGPNFIVSVIERSDKLLAQANEGSFSELAQIEDNTFFSRTLYSTIKFKTEVDEFIMIWTNNEGRSFNGTRILK